MPEDSFAFQRRLRTGFVLAVLAVAIFAIWTAGGFRTAARLFPQYAGYALLGVCLLELGRQALRRGVLGTQAPSTADIGLEDEERTPAGMARALGLFGWLLGFGGLILVLGMPLATIVFVPALLHLRFRSDWRATLAIVAGLLALMWVLRLGLNLRLPPGLLGLLS